MIDDTSKDHVSHRSALGYGDHSAYAEVWARQTSDGSLEDSHSTAGAGKPCGQEEAQLPEQAICTWSGSRPDCLAEVLVVRHTTHHYH